ncbi:MAG: HD domain-containing phosphohydrolase [Thermodesulfovibrionales bacterium]|jgi:HD-GYP domain-containing protein (c-di-GMP phosphodiesterase class II)
MSIEEIRFFTRHGFPEKVLDSFNSLSDALSSLSPFIYIMVIAILVMIIVFAMRKLRGIHTRTQQRKEVVQSLAMAHSLQDYITILTGFLKESNPSIKNIGIYLKEQSTYKLMSADTYEDDVKDKSMFTETVLTDIREYEKTGRYHVYTFALPDKSSAIRVLSLEAINYERLKTDLAYLSALLENFLEKDLLKGELLKTKVLKEVKDLFSASSFNLQNYFTFIGNIILKAVKLDGVRILTGDTSIHIGSNDFKSGTCKLLKVRNTDITIEICRKQGINQEDIVHIGRFLDLISAMLSFYTNKPLAQDFIYVLDNAVRASENSDSYYKRHSEKVEILAIMVGEKLGLDPGKLENLRYAAKLHDIGMIGDIYELTLKDLKFSEKDYGILKYHPLIGATLTAPIDSVYPISNIILQHHELCDGTGYPNGIKSGDFLQESKVLAFCEMLVGLISDRAHRKGYSIDLAVQQISNLVPAKIDRDVFMAFIDQKEAVMKKLQELI